MKNITIAGGIGKDAVVRNTNNGEKVTGWSVAVEERNGQEKRTLWFDVTLWGKRGEVLASYLTKGTKVAVSGELSTREHEGKTYLTLRADNVTLMGGGEQRQQKRVDHNAIGSGSADARKNSISGGRSMDFDDSIPF